MSELHTPTTDEIRSSYGFCDDRAIAKGGFDRWLAAHDAEVYQRGREDAAKAASTLRSSNKKDENGWYLFDHCYECMGAAAGYDMAVEDAVAAARGEDRM